MKVVVRLRIDPAGPNRPQEDYDLGAYRFDMPDEYVADLQSHYARDKAAGYEGTFEEYIVETIDAEMFVQTLRLEP